MGNFTENRDKTLTQDDFVRRLARSNGVSNAEAYKWVNNVKKELMSCLLDGLAIKFVNFGRLEPRYRRGRRILHNAVVGGKTTISPDMIVAHLTASHKLNERLTIAAKNRGEKIGNEQ